MRNRWLNLGFVLFQAFWLNVVIPGHQRGIVQMPGAKSACPCCCCDTRAAEPNSKTPARKTSTCAICFFAAHLSIPPAINLNHPPLRFLHLLRPENHANLIYQACNVPFDTRGPPASC